MNALIQPFMELSEFTKIKKAILEDKTPILANGIVDSQKCHLIFGILTNLKKNAVVITSNELKSKELYEDLNFFFKESLMLYPSKDLIFYSSDVHSMDIVEKRIEVLKALNDNQPKVVILSVEALLDRLVEKKQFNKFVTKIKVGSNFVINDMANKFTRMGYVRKDLVEAKGQFSIRGGIIDIFPIVDEQAYRIELWDDEVDSIRIMDVKSQRSVDKIDEIEIYPAVELVLEKEQVINGVKNIKDEAEELIKKFEIKGLSEEKERLEAVIDKITTQICEKEELKGLESYITYFNKETCSLLEYFDKDTILFMDEPVRIAEKYKNVYFEFEESIKTRLEKGYLLKNQANMIFDYGQLLYKIDKYDTVLLNTLSTNIKDFTPRESVNFNVRSLNPYHQQMELMEKDIKKYLSSDYKILLLAGSRNRAEILVEQFRENNIHAVYSDKLVNPLSSGEIVISKGSIHKGFEYVDLKYIVISESEVYGNKPKKKVKRKRFKGNKINNFSELNVGEYVVHENHGVGIYRGIEQVEINGISKDYLKITYKDGGNLYIPTNQLDMVQKYIGSEGKKPKVHKLGGTEWIKAKQRVKKAVVDLAEELVKLYASREAKVGYQFSEDTVWQNEFEEMFPYDETEDQLTSIEETKKDMESSKIMDRLICGDVGYGKTEVAIRAAFKAVQDGKQVAYLVPTTILAQQHYNNFAERMKEFPVNVGLLSRFKTKKQQSQTLEEARKGLVDIVIGTHRLLSKDVKFKDLGLLIIDEEQRFGVTHKEKIKQLKQNIDVLMLTATPIPRTLHMSLIGIREMSVLQEPPHERQPIQTYVLEYNSELIKDAIYRELNRGGQVYYVYNRVGNIDLVTQQLKQIVPEATVCYAHGQMSERQLEEIMIEFINGEIDVLVCTTIIETGLDIANANTMIIQDADYMGLSQLYQLRGRVGRSNKIAYAYLMYKKDKVLQQTAEKRLQAIREFTEFGSGFKIAMRDLEIRGAGNILGSQQHGHMDAVGYELYCKMLEEAVEKVQDQGTQEKFETTVKFDVDAYIPSSYISSEVQKLEVYKKIASIENEQDYYDMQEELEDRYGDLPNIVNNLLEISLIKAMAHDGEFTNVEQKGDKVVLEYRKDAKIDGSKIPNMMKKYMNELFFVYSGTPKFNIKTNKKSKEEVIYFIKNILHDLNELKL